jgi:hypothetical protein
LGDLENPIYVKRNFKWNKEYFGGFATYYYEPINAEKRNNHTEYTYFPSSLNSSGSVENPGEVDSNCYTNQKNFLY